MSLLPLNQTSNAQNFADLLDIQTIEDYSILNTDPLVCHLSLLAHIAFGLNVDISSMTEPKARVYLKNIQKGRNIAGTVQAVEDAIDIFLGEGKLVEWFEDERLSRGHFMIVTQQDEVKTFLQNIKYFKNVRSKLVSVSDNQCSPRTKLDFNHYDESILSDTDGVLVNGVRVCFKKESFKTLEVIQPTLEKQMETIINHTLSIDTPTMKKSILIDRHMGVLIARGWVGQWIGSWDDSYVVSVNKVNLGEL